MSKSFALLIFRRIFAVPNEGNQIIGVWRSWLAHLVWDQRVLCSSHSTPTRKQLSIGSCFFLYIFDPASLGRAFPVHKNRHFCGQSDVFEGRIHKNRLFHGQGKF